MIELEEKPLQSIIKEKMSEASLRAVYVPRNLRYVIKDIRKKWNGEIKWSMNIGNMHTSN